MASESPKLCPQCGKANLPTRIINLCSEIAETVRQRPDLSYKQIAAAFQVSEKTVKRHAKRAGINRPAGVKKIS